MRLFFSEPSGIWLSVRFTFKLIKWTPNVCNSPVTCLSNSLQCYPKYQKNYSRAFQFIAFTNWNKQCLVSASYPRIKPFRESSNFLFGRKAKARWQDP